MHPIESGSAMTEFSFDVPTKGDNGPGFFLLTKDNKTICRARCNIPIRLPFSWSITEMVAPSTVQGLSKLTCVPIHPAWKDSHQKREWRRFMNFLQTYGKIAVSKFKQYDIYILPPDGNQISGHCGNNLTVSTAKVAYREKEAFDPCCSDDHLVAVPKDVTIGWVPQYASEPDAYMKAKLASPTREGVATTKPRVDGCAFESNASTKGSGSGTEGGAPSSVSRCLEMVGESKIDAVISLRSTSIKGSVEERNFVRTDPSYLRTLGQSHSSWIFGAIAELADNARDAQATGLDIAINSAYFKKAGGDIPVLSVIDDGHGMNHQDICRMVSFGHKQQEGDDPERIGRFGIGFKSGTMRLGKDALVLTQTVESRSIAFLSQSLNDGKDNLEIPIVSYRRQGKYMELDRQFQSDELAEYNLRCVKEFSPFNEYMIGEKAANFHERTGTQIYIWNLDNWGSDYCLEWKSGRPGGSSFYQGDILIRSGRVRSRTGQTSRKVPLDSSLRVYLEVVFLDPRMKIYIQGSLVKGRPLAKSLSKTVVKTGVIRGKDVFLTLGRCQIEWEHANCGIFLYWHGRLIEAYKRVGGMLYSADIGRGVIGVVDVTNLMDDGSGCVYVHNNKQGFQDCEPYALLEEWLAERVDEYCDANFDALQVVLLHGAFQWKM